MATAPELELLKKSLFAPFEPKKTGNETGRLAPGQGIGDSGQLQKLKQASAGNAPDARTVSAILFAPPEKRDPLAGVDQTRGADPVTRLQAAFKTDAGKINFLKEKFGEDGVAVKGGQIVITPPGGTPRVFDPSREDGGIGDLLGDVADVVPDIGRTVAGVGGSILGGAAAGASSGGVGAPTGAALGGAAGDALAEGAIQGVSSFIPGDDELTAGGRAKRVGREVAFGLAGEGVGAVAGRAGRALTKGGRDAAAALAAQKLVKQEAGEVVTSASGLRQLSGEFAEDGKKLQQAIREETGEDFSFTPDQITGTRTRKAIRRKLEASDPEFATKQLGREIEQAQTHGRFLDKTLKRIAGNPELLSRGETGARVASAVTRHVENLVSVRTQAADRAFRAVDEAAGEAGAVAIKLPQAISAIKEIIGDSKLQTPITRSLKKQLKEIVDSGGDSTNAGGLNNLLKRWGKVASGNKTVFEGIDRSERQAIGKKIFAAIQRDMDNHIDGTARLGGGIEELRAARDQFRQHSEVINATSTKLVKRILGLGAEDSEDRIVSTILDSKAFGEKQTGKLFKILETTDPDAARQLRANVIDEIIERGDPVGGSARAFGDVREGRVVTAESMVKLFGKHKKKLSDIYRGDPSSAIKVRQIFQSAERIADTARLGREGGSNAVGLISGPLVDGLLKAPRAGFTAAVIDKVAGTLNDAVVTKLFSQNNLKRLYSTPAGVDMLTGLTRISALDNPTFKQVSRAGKILARMVAHARRGDELEDTEDDTDGAPGVARLGAR